MQLVSVDEYLSTSYEYDPDFVDGVLVERGAPTVPHSLLQAILCGYLLAPQDQYGFNVLPSVRTQIVARTRYRVPDLVLCPRPLPRRIVDATPVAVIDILSPDDRVADTLERFRDYAHIGVQSLVLMDPERHVAYRFENGSLIEGPLTQLGTIPFDSEAIFAQLRSEIVS